MEMCDYCMITESNTLKDRKHICFLLSQSWLEHGWIRDGGFILKAVCQKTVLVGTWAAYHLTA